MTKTRTRRRSWWTACSPYLEGFEGVPVFDLATSFDGERARRVLDPDAALAVREVIPMAYKGPIAHALEDGPKTFEALAFAIAGVDVETAIGTAFEFALWAMVEAGAVKVSPETPVKFAAWYSVVRPNFERAYDRTLERRYA